MRKSTGYAALVVAASGAWMLATLRHDSAKPAPPPLPKTEGILPAGWKDADYRPLEILYPLDETLFPPEIAAPTFRWKESPTDISGWLVVLEFADGGESMQFSCGAPQWTPSDEDWETIKGRSLEKAARVTILAYLQTDPPRIVSGSTISISTSEDKVGAPLFFREVNLPFSTAVKDPAAYIRWRFGEISSKEPPPIVLEKMPVCGNCHSFSADGGTLAMEVDSGNDKAAYAITPVSEQIVLDPDKMITWSDYRREDNEKTFGLLCQVSPDGRYVVGTVKDRALAVYRSELAFSQLFFLVKGIMAVYDRQTQTFSALPGADDITRVQTNGTWSPDGKTIVFSRSVSEAYEPPSLRHLDSVLVPKHEADEFLEGGRKFMYDLYRIPFNDGKGGVAEPIPGASNNGMSNYFPKFSPDGKWIVFCKARSFMLLQPDSELYVIPAEGGEARRLRCNTPRMNSWHSWSPNGKWLVFSSKANTVYTQLFLTHIDDEGRSTPAVVLANFTEENRAANIPEFVNVKPGAIRKIHEQFLDDTNYVRAGNEFDKQGDYVNAIPRYRKAAEINPNNALAHANWGACLLQLGKLDEAMPHLIRAIEIEPGLVEAHCNLGSVLMRQERFPEAVKSYRKAIEHDPDFAAAHLRLGTLLSKLGQLEEAKVHLQEAVRIHPHDPYNHFNLGIIFCQDRQFEQGVVHFNDAIQRDPDFLPALISLSLIRSASPVDALRNGPQAVELATRACELSRYENPMALHALAAAYAEVGRFPDALATVEVALRITRGAAQEAFAKELQRMLGLLQQQKPYRSSPR